MIVKNEKPPRSARRNTRSKAVGKAKVKAFTDTNTRSVVLPKTIDMEVLKQLGVDEEVTQLFDNIRWGFFVDWPAEVNVDLVKEFYINTKVEFDKEGAPCGVECTLGKDKYK